MKAIIAASLVLFATGCNRSSSGPGTQPAPPPASQKQYNLEGKVSVLLKAFLSTARAETSVPRKKLADLTPGDLCSSNPEDRCAVLVQMTSDGVAYAQEKDSLPIAVAIVNSESSKFKFEMTSALADKEVYKILILKSNFSFDVQGKALASREMTLLGSDANVAGSSETAAVLEVNPEESYVSKAKLNALVAHASDSVDDIKALIASLSEKGKRIMVAIAQFSGEDAAGDAPGAFLDSISSSPLKSIIDAKIAAEMNRASDQEDGQSLVSSLKVARDSGKRVADGSLNISDIDAENGFIVPESLSSHLDLLSNSEKEMQVDQMVRLSVSIRKDWGRTQTMDDAKYQELLSKVNALAPKQICAPQDPAACKPQQDALAACNAAAASSSQASLFMGPPCMSESMNAMFCAMSHGAPVCTTEDQSAEYVNAQAELNSFQSNRENSDEATGSKLRLILSSIRVLLGSFGEFEYSIPLLTQYPEYQSEGSGATFPISDRPQVIFAD
jgi:hypothetical protein